jgi:hypothetical protein
MSFYTINYCNITILNYVLRCTPVFVDIESRNFVQDCKIIVIKLFSFMYNLAF